MSSLSTGSSSLVNVVGKGTHRFLSTLTPETCRPSIAFGGLSNSPFIVLMVADVSLPGIQRWSLDWSNIKVPWLQLSKIVYVRITLLPQLPLIFTGTTVHILITFDPVLIDAHFTSSWLLAVASVAATSSVPFFNLFFSILTPCIIAGCWPLQTLYCFLLGQLFALCSFEIPYR